MAYPAPNVLKGACAGMIRASRRASCVNNVNSVRVDSGTVRARRANRVNSESVDSESVNSEPNTRQLGLKADPRVRHNGTAPLPQRPPCSKFVSAYFRRAWLVARSSRCCKSQDAGAARSLLPSQRCEMSTTSGSRGRRSQSLGLSGGEEIFSGLPKFFGVPNVPGRRCRDNARVT